jgi:hypothetical protein
MYRKAKMIAVPAALVQICRSYHSRADSDVQKYVKLDQNSQGLLEIAALPHGTACMDGWWWCHEAESYIGGCEAAYSKLLDRILEEVDWSDAIRG